MAVDEGLVEWVREALAPIGSVTMRRMMGGATLYCDGTVFAIAGDGELWFKADGESDALWDAEACPRFTYAMGVGRTGSMNYRRAPDAVYDDADVMRRWAAVAIEAGLRAPKRKPRSRPR
ncbi:TfoX/Sxy family protein [Sphingosinithalassobacter sp. CS137]|uniref:TfoX/Sxy family protein n=1 Tax=Sphingosinithalassobacter sp. CS137 TaxID=2762748 RepID=UPI00165E9DC0|nr:TfoX/Sxy family protein [Sphingosinithalassobacter sp. CS137]